MQTKPQIKERWGNVRCEKKSIISRKNVLTFSSSSTQMDFKLEKCEVNKRLTFIIVVNIMIWRQHFQELQAFDIIFIQLTPWYSFKCQWPISSTCTEWEMLFNNIKWQQNICYLAQWGCCHDGYSNCAFSCPFCQNWKMESNLPSSTMKVYFYTFEGSRCTLYWN